MNLLGALLKDLTLYLSLIKNVVITVISDKEGKKMANCYWNINKGCPHREEGGSTKSGYLQKMEGGREELTISGCPLFHGEFLGFLSKMSKILLQSTSKSIENSLRTVKSKSSGSCLLFVITWWSIKNGTCGHVVRSKCSQKVRTYLINVPQQDSNYPCAIHNL